MIRILARASARAAPCGLSLAHYASEHPQPTAARAPAGAAAAPLRQCIGGSLVPSTSARTVAVEDPSTGAVIGSIPEGTAEDAHAALVAARAAQPAWAARSATDRGKALKAMARVVRENRVELAELLASEQNKTLGLAQVEIDFTAEYFDYYAGLARAYEGELVNSDDANEHISVHRLPVGVSVGICPWNFPVFVMARKLAPALLAGCAVVVKSSEVTPLACGRLAELWLASPDADLPPRGAWALVNGLGATVGAALTASPLADIVSMTGSVPTGKAIMRAAAENMTKVSLELGGKAPAIVAADADLDLAVAAVVASRICFSGQVCNCCERVYVHASVYEPFVAKLVAAMEAVTVGAPRDAAADCCGLVNAAQRQGRRHGAARSPPARRRCGGRPLPGPGYKYAPTVLTGCAQGSEIVQEEVFGPVLPVLAFGTLTEAFALANDSKFGLTSSIYSSSVDVVERARAELRFGETYVNRENFEAIQGFHAGMRQSGVGGADGKRGLDEYLATHVVYVRRNPKAGD
ncbi:succinate-semialdehyde dehydrogenase [Aureococcus anophagefferens]|nr:succinate-semialdehyde dehydrogenase [Aureococcus anophagefferens]